MKYFCAWGVQIDTHMVGFRVLSVTLGSEEERKTCPEDCEVAGGSNQYNVDPFW